MFYCIGLAAGEKLSRMVDLLRLFPLRGIVGFQLQVCTTFSH